MLQATKFPKVFATDARIKCKSQELDPLSIVVVSVGLCENDAFFILCHVCAVDEVVVDQPLPTNSHAVPRRGQMRYGSAR